MARLVRHLRACAREERGFGMIELLAAITVLLIGLMAVFAVFNAGLLQIRRASTITTAAALADAEMERFRAIKYESIGLADADVAAADATYQGDSAYRADTSPTTSLAAAVDASATSITVSSATGFPAASPYIVQVDSERMLVTGGAGTTTWTVTRAYAGTAAASHATSATVTQRQRVDLTACADPPTQPCTSSEPTRSVTGADGRAYRVDTYVTWRQIGNSQDPAATGRLVKLVTLVVRDSAAPHREWARLSSAFDESTGV